MSKLDVPHIKQAGLTHCGVACLEMVYKYFGVFDVDQNMIWKQRKTPRSKNNEFFMLTRSIVDDLVFRDFNVIWGQFVLDEKLCAENIERLVDKEIPIIVCKQWAPKPLLGHFVVVVGIEGDVVFYLDPELDNGLVEKDIATFVDEWRSLDISNPNREVIGGQFIIMGNQSRKLIVDRLHLVNFNVPCKLQKFCLENVSFLD